MNPIAGWPLDNSCMGLTGRSFGNLKIIANQIMNTTIGISCKLTAPELQKRKVTVIGNLGRQISGKKELPDGFAFGFPGTDKVLDELLEFIKMERECCSFFSFHLSVSGDIKETWLTLTGPEGTKDFIQNELMW